MNHSLPFFSLLLLFFVQNINAQDFAQVDEHARSTPEGKASSIEKLAEHLTKGCSSETEKARAIYVWMAENIRYSTATLHNESLTVEQRLKRQEPERVLRSKKAVCEGYSNLFVAICGAAGLDALIVTGYTKLPNGKIAPVGHAWNAVRVEEGWKLMDVTWGAGGVDGRNGKYVKSLSDEFFLADPGAFVQHHLPHDPLFQLLPVAVDYQTFKSKMQIETSSPKTGETAEINAKVDAHFKLAKEEQVLASSQRTIEFDPENGFANFTLSKHHYEKALALYQQFFEASQNSFDKKLPLTSAMVKRWESNLGDYRANLEISENYLGNIRPGDPVSEAAKISRNAIRQAWKISRDTDKQFEEYHRYLARTGR